MNSNPRGLSLTAAAAVLALTSCGGADDTGSEPLPTSSPSAPTASPSISPSEPSSPVATPCDQVPPVPSDREIDRAVDPEAGTVTISFRPDGAESDSSFTIAYRDDPTCKERHDIEPIISALP